MEHFQCNSILRNLIYTQYCWDNLFCEAKNICIIYQFFYGFGNILFLHLELSWRLKQRLYHFLYSEKCFSPLWHSETISRQYEACDYLMRHLEQFREG